MLHPRKPLMTALTQQHRNAFFAEIDRVLAQHEAHARVTTSEGAYHAAMKMARTLRATRAYLAADDVDAVCSDLSAYIMATDAAVRMSRFTQQKGS